MMIAADIREKRVILISADQNMPLMFKFTSFSDRITDDSNVEILYHDCRISLIWMRQQLMRNGTQFASHH
jgi:hypothetical protein